MICTKCGNEVVPGRYCNKCGTLAADTPPIQPPPPPPPPPMGAAPMSMPPPPSPYNSPVKEAEMIGPIPKIKDYVIMMLIAMIPVAGFVMMIIWAVGGNDTPLWKSNYARAYWIFTAISFGIAMVLTLIISAIVMATVGTIVGSSGSSYYYW